MSALVPVWTCDDGAPKVLAGAASLPVARALWLNSKHAAVSSAGVLHDVRGSTADHHARAMERAAEAAWRSREIAPATPAPFVPRTPSARPAVVAPVPAVSAAAPAKPRRRPAKPRAKIVAAPRRAPKPRKKVAPVAVAVDVEPSVPEMLARFGAIVRRAGGLDALEALLDAIDNARGAR